MNVRDIASAMVDGSGITRAAAEAALQAALDCIARGVCAGHRVSLPGIGALTAVPRKARRARHPASGAEIIIPARITVTLAPSPGLLARLNMDEPVGQ